MEASRGQHLPGQPAGWPSQVKYGQVDQLCAHVAGETGPDRRILGDSRQQRHLPPPNRKRAGVGGSHGHPGLHVPAAHAQPVRGELPEDGAAAAGVSRPADAGSGHAFVRQILQYC